MEKNLKTIKCSDFGLNCDFAIKDENMEEVVKRIKEHGMSVHPESVKQMMAGKSEEEIDKIIKSKIKEEKCEC
ncbi:DUF1059 domain-containing protein [Candidatus Wolfebacteria bacterium]|nr:DUF1059 domain-containing protein [Candidatus Wolfebacteria bacterium]